jgi:predicted TIM-barrel fold metal-dependent hydrolase
MSPTPSLSRCENTCNHDAHEGHNNVVNDAHCHFFSTPFFAPLGGEPAIARLGWDAPGTPEALADRWVAELDTHRVSRAALMASVPLDAASVASAVARHPTRFVGFFMVDPTQPRAADEAASVVERDGMRAICLFPAMHRYAIQDARARAIFDVAAATPGTAVFVHCGVLSVSERNSDYRARSTSASATQSICTPSPSGIRPCRSSCRISARDFFAKL